MDPRFPWDICVEEQEVPMNLMLGLTDNKVEQEGSSNFLMDSRRE